MTYGVQEVEKRLILSRSAVFHYVNLRKDDEMFYFYAGITQPVFKWLLLEFTFTTFAC